MIIKKILYCSLVILLASSCTLKPSFTDENIIPSLKRILSEDCDIDALVGRKEKTLGVCFEVPKLFSANKKTMPVVIDQMQAVMLCLRRVLLSTDCDIEFFQINIRGKDTGVEISLIRYLRDLKILLMSGISYGDYNKRMLYRNVTNIAALGLKRIELFFEDLGAKKPEEIFAYHFAPQIFKKNISQKFITWLWESIMKLDIKNEILETRMIAKSESLYYFYCKVREEYTPKQGFQNFTFTTHSGDITEYIFEISSVSFFNVLVNRIEVISEAEKLDENSFARKLFRVYGEPSKWPVNDFYVETLAFKDFIAEQIAGRVQGKLVQDEMDKNVLVPSLTAVKGYFENGAINLLFIYKDQNMKQIEKNHSDFALNTAKEVCDLYKFKDCTEIKIGTLQGGMTSYTR